MHMIMKAFDGRALLLVLGLLLLALWSILSRRADRRAWEADRARLVALQAAQCPVCGRERERVLPSGERVLLPPCRHLAAVRPVGCPDQVWMRPITTMGRRLAWTKVQCPGIIREGECTRKEDHA